jgi:hypothetical protein
MKHTIVHWRIQLRREVRVKDEKDISQADIEAHNLIWWGGPSSDVILDRIVDKLSLMCTRESVQIGE